MNFFKKLFEDKNKKDDPLPCNHKWKDFPWYVDSVYYTNIKELHFKIVEPYVCIHCKARKDIALYDTTQTNVSKKEAVDYLDLMMEKYGEHIKPRPIVEDMINDTQLVDRKYLEIVTGNGNYSQTPKLKVGE